MKTTKQRLDQYRAKASDSRNQYPNAKNWCYWKHPIWSMPNNTRGDEGQIFSESIEQYGEEVADDKLRFRVLSHSGWYSDSFNEDLIKPTVTKLRCPKGTLYIPITFSDNWNSVTHYLRDAELVPKGSDEEAHEEAIKDALRSADSHAECMAEEAREWDAKNRAENDITEARDTIHKINQRVLALGREIKAAQFTPAVCTALKERINEFLAERRVQFQLIEERENDFWTAV